MTSNTGPHIENAGAADTPVHISVLLDRSGSMRQIADDIVGGFNEFVAEQQANPASARLSLIQFDSHEPFEVVHDGIDLAHIEALGRDDYRPRGSTPLYDAIGMLLERIDRTITARADRGLPIEDQLIAIITDGLENASLHYSRQQVFDLIAERRGLAWTFVFLGADAETLAQGKGIGLTEAESRQWDATSAGTKKMWQYTSQAVTSTHVRQNEAAADQPSTPADIRNDSVRYGAGYRVHHIQARIAREDTQNWQAARLDRVDDQLLEVTFDDGRTTTYWSSTANRVAPFVGRGVEVSERRGLLRAATRGGYQLVSLATTDLPELVFGIEPPSRYDEGWFYVVPKEDATHAAEVVDIVTTCTTWGQVRSAASPELYEELLQHSGHGDFEDYVEPMLTGRPIPGLEQDALEEYHHRHAGGLPADEDPFDPDDVSGYATLDYPLAFEAMQNGSLPAHVLDYADIYETTLNGTHASFPVDIAREVLDTLRRRGYVCSEDKALLVRGMDRDPIRPSSSD